MKTSEGSKRATKSKKEAIMMKSKAKMKIASLELLPCLDKVAILPREFFEIDALDLAPRLLGKFLRRDEVVLQITEVEAYRPNDSACHARFGITPRTAPVFGAGGHAYVYLCYGLHTMLNVVADREGLGAAVLIRSCAPITGLDTIQKRRGQKTEKPVLLTGPGKIGQALGISTEWSNHPLYSPGGLEILDGPEPEKMLVGPRVGIEYALPEHASALWRFAIAGSYECMNDPSIMEAMTRESPYFALECGFLEMVLEVELSNTYANLVSEDEIIRAGVVNDVRECMKPLWSVKSVMFPIPRDLNKVAPWIAKYARRVNILFGLRTP